MKQGTRVWVPAFNAWATIGEALPLRLCQNNEPHWRLNEFGAFAMRSEFLTEAEMQSPPFFRCGYCGCMEAPYARAAGEWPSCPQCNGV